MSTSESTAGPKPLARDYLEELRQAQRTLNDTLTAAGRENNYLRSLIRTLAEYLPKDHPYWPGVQEVIDGLAPEAPSSQIEQLRAQEQATYRAAQSEYHRLRELLRRVRPRMTEVSGEDVLAAEVDEEINRAEIKTHLIAPHAKWREAVQLRHRALERAADEEPSADRVSSKAWITERNTSVGVLRLIERGSTVELGTLQAALRFAVAHLDGLPEHWVIGEERESSEKVSLDALQQRDAFEAWVQDRHPEYFCPSIGASYHSHPGYCGDYADPMLQLLWCTWRAARGCQATPAGSWVIQYDNQARHPDLFSGYGAGEAARQRFEFMRNVWPCTLTWCPLVTGRGATPENATAQGSTHAMPITTETQTNAPTSTQARAQIAERVLQAVETWRAEHQPSCAESVWQVDSIHTEAPQLVEDILNIAGYHHET